MTYDLLMACYQTLSTCLLLSPVSSLSLSERNFVFSPFYVVLPLLDIVPIVLDRFPFPFTFPLPAVTFSAIVMHISDKQLFVHVRQLLRDRTGQDRTDMAWAACFAFWQHFGFVWTGMW